jgi:hypothetical protein
MLCILIYRKLYIVIYRLQKGRVINLLIEDFNCLKYSTVQTDSILDLLSTRYANLSTQAKIEPLLTYPPIKNQVNLQNNDPNYGLVFKNSRVYIIKLFSTELKIYPNMLMLQVIIIMLIGLVAQLFASDKTVTEPL